jgi:hypothetical protein
MWRTLALLALLPLLACAGKAPQVADEQTSIPAVGLRLRLPPPYAVYEGSPGTMIIDLRPGGRAPRTISLKLLSGANPECDEERMDQERLGPGGHTRYRIEQVSGGMGGSEATLHGCWHHGARVYSVRCDHQDEERPDAGFCLAVLATAELIEVHDRPPTVGAGGFAGPPPFDRPIHENPSSGDAPRD